jgi:hypothetical protein
MLTPRRLPPAATTLQSACRPPCPAAFPSPNARPAGQPHPAPPQAGKPSAVDVHGGHAAPPDARPALTPAHSGPGLAASAAARAAGSHRRKQSHDRGGEWLHPRPVRRSRVVGQWRRGVSVGVDLAEARRRVGLTVTQVSKKTRIREAVIRGIEGDDYSLCGGDFYARGHIRAIARAVGADPGPLLAAYDAARRAPPATAAELLQPVTPLKVRGGGGRPGRRCWSSRLRPPGIRRIPGDTGHASPRARPARQVYNDGRGGGWPPGGHAVLALSVRYDDLPEQAVAFVVGPGGEQQLAGFGGVAVAEPQAPQPVDHDRLAVWPAQLA